MTRHAWRTLWRASLAIVPCVVAGALTLGPMSGDLAPKRDGACPLELKGTTDVPASPPPPPPKAKEVTIEPWELVQV